MTLLASSRQTGVFEQRTSIRPTPIIPAGDGIRLPAPKDPPALHLIRLDLRCEPGSVPRDVVVRRGEVGVGPLEVVRDAEAEFADEGGPVTAAVVVAGEFEVGGGGVAGGGVVDAVFVGPFDVAVVVVGGEVVVGEVLVGVAGAPFGVLRYDGSVDGCCRVKRGESIPSFECARGCWG